MTIAAAFDVPSTDLYFEVIDTVREQHQYLALQASFAPPVTHYSSCFCGAVLEIRGDHAHYTDDDYTAIREFADDHAYCEISA